MSDSKTEFSHILENLRKSVIEFDVDSGVKWAKKAVDERIDPSVAADKVMEGISEIGDAFGRGELFLPDLIIAAEVMKAAMMVLQEEILNVGKERKAIGKIVIGTVFGDIHNIGKDLVSTLCTAAGFEVIDLGVQVSAEKFVEAVKENHPDILAMSALLTTTAPEQKKVIRALKKEGLRDQIKIIVGGGAVTPEFAEEIEADGYEPTATDGVKLAKKLVGLD